MRNILFLFISISVFTTFSCNNKNSNDPANVKYPSSFSSIKVNQNLCCLKVPGKDIFCIFDSKDGKVMGAYSFENYCRFAYTMLVDEDVYLAAYSMGGETQERAILRVSLSTGKVTMLPFYNKYAGRFALVDNKIWIDTTEMVTAEKHKIEVFDPNTGDVSFTQVPWTFIDRGISIDGADYMTVLNNGTISILNRKTGSLSKASNLFDVKFNNNSTAGNFMPMCDQTHLFSIKGTVERTNSFQSILYRIKSFKPLSYTKVITLPDSEEMGPAVEMNGYVYLFTRLKGSSTDLKVRKFNSTTLSIIEQSVVSNANPSVAKGYDAVWCMSKSQQGKYKLLRIDPDTLKVKEYPCL